MMSLPFVVMLLTSLALVFEAFVPGSISEMMPGSMPDSMPGSLPAPLIEFVLCVLMFGAAVQLRPRAPWRPLVLSGNLTLLTALLTIVVVAVGMRWVCAQLGIELPPAYAFAFAALIVPTEPLVMLRAMTFAGAPSAVGRRILAEPLLACMAGLVVFEVALQRADGVRGAISASMLEQAGGAVLLGACLGLAMIGLLRLRPHALLAGAAALAVVFAGWYAGQSLPLSGPLAAACAGLLIAFQRDEVFGGAMQRERFEAGAARVAGVLAALLPAVLGAALLAMDGGSGRHIVAAVFALPLVVLVRGVLVAALVWLLGLRIPTPRSLPKTTAWAGLRGGFAAALALMLPGGDTAVLVTATFAVLVFSWLLQWPVCSIHMRSARPLDPLREERSVEDGSG